jgi:hypothetical protein
MIQHQSVQMHLTSDRLHTSITEETEAESIEQEYVRCKIRARGMLQALCVRLCKKCILADSGCAVLLCTDMSATSLQGGCVHVPEENAFVLM